LALRRFIAVRGQVAKIYSDCGTNLIGSHNIDRREQDKVEDVEFPKLQRELATTGVVWEFNVPTASQRMGFVERRIRVLRALMSSTLVETGKRLLDREEISTFFAEVCHIINSTPFTAVGSAEDPAPLTPLMLLTLKEGTHPEEHEYGPADLLEYGKNRWRRVRYLGDLFFKRFAVEFLHELNQRRKWLRPTRPLATGDVVILKEKNTRRNHWPLATVVEASPGHDGLVRTARVRTAHTGPDGKISFRFYDRPCTSLVVLVPAGEPDTPTGQRDAGTDRESPSDHGPDDEEECNVPDV
jgi:hypothetical protein